MANKIGTDLVRTGSHLVRSQVSVVVTVLNEIKTIEGLIKALKSQTYKKFEVIIVDGGSTDGTSTNLKSQISNLKNFRLHIKEGNRSVSRNYGVAKAEGNIIAFTDAGCIPEKDWLENLVRPFKDPNIKVVSGYYKGLPITIFEKCLIPYVLVMPDQIKGEFLSATRSMAIKKSLFNQTGGFNEQLWHNEDYAFAIKLKNQSIAFHFVQDAVVFWQPRKTLKSAAWMFLRFAIGDAQAGIFRSKVKFLAIRYYLFFFLVFLNPWFWFLVFPYVVWAVFKNYKYVKDLRALYWLPILQVTSDIMVLFGTMVGLLSRIK